MFIRSWEVKLPKGRPLPETPEVMLKLLHVLFVPLSAYELFPGEEQIIYRNDIVIGMSELNIPGTPPPAKTFAGARAARQNV